MYVSDGIYTHAIRHGCPLRRLPEKEYLPYRTFPLPMEDMHHGKVGEDATDNGFGVLPESRMSLSPELLLSVALLYIAI